MSSTGSRCDLKATQEYVGRDPMSASGPKAEPTARYPDSRLTPVCGLSSDIVPCQPLLLRSMKATCSQSMQTHWVRYMPIARAAPRVRSSVTPRVNGPRSLITTVTDLPFSGFVTVTRDPKGSVRCAAAYPLESRHGLNCGNGDLTESDARFGSSVALCNRRPPVDVRISPLATEIAWRCNMSRRAATSRLTFLGSHARLAATVHHFAR
jgi:hypothetical protein